MKAPAICSYVDHELADQWVDEPSRVMEVDSVIYPEYFRRAGTCKFCGRALLEVEYQTQPVFVCSECGWWHFACEVVHGPSPYAQSHYYFARGIAKYYDISSIEVPLIDLQKYLAKHPTHVAHTHPTRFEQLMAECLRSAYGDAHVVHVGGTGDGGVDLILVTSCGETYLVQVKRRQSLDAKEGVQVVRELHGVLFREGTARGMVITTAAGFTKGAIQEVREVRKRHATYDVVLIALPGVIDMLNLPKPDPYEPWAEVLRSILPG